MQTDQLQQLGLSQKEALTYIELLREKESTVSALSKKTKINRTVLYYVLDELVRKGLAAYIIKSDLRYYRATEPDKIMQMLAEKEQIAKTLIPQLSALYSPETKKPIIEVVEGKEGIKGLLNDILRQKKDWLAFDIPGKGPEVFGAYVVHYEKERQKLKIPTKIICLKTEKSLKRGKQFAAMKYTEVRYNPEPFESPVSNWIYGDRVVIMFWHKEPFAIRIINQELADSYRNSFMLRWKFLEKNKVLP